MSEYPKRMKGLCGVVSVAGPPGPDGYVAYVDSDGNWGIDELHDLHPLPSPDDEVEVVVKMTRRQRDTIAYETLPATPLFLWSACRAHRDAES